METVDAGLCSGLGVPEPGKMCVEAAVCFALGLPHGDHPTCVSVAVREFKIGLNDAKWSSNQARAKGMRRIAIAQIGSEGTVNDVDFVKLLSKAVIQQILPHALRAAASIHPQQGHRDALNAVADRCKREGTVDAASYAASAASDAASDASDAASDASDAASYASYAASAASYAASDASDAASYAASYAASAASYAASYAASAARYAASDASYAASYASYAASDAILSWAAEVAFEALAQLGSPGVEWANELATEKASEPYKLAD